MRRGVLVTVAGIVVFAFLVAAVTPLREGAGAVLRGDTAELRDDLRDLGFAGVLVLFALIVSHAVLFYPSEIVNAAAGYVYGFGPALALVMVGWTVSGLAAYAIGRHVGRPALQRLAGQRRLDRAERAVDRGGTVGLLAARLIPIVPYSVVGYVAGAARVPLWRFTWTTFAGSLPLCATAVYLGGRLEELSLSDPTVWIAVAIVLALLIGGHQLARGRMVQPDSRTSSEPAPSSSSASGGPASASPQPQSHASASSSSSGPKAS